MLVCDKILKFFIVYWIWWVFYFIGILGLLNKSLLNIFKFNI